jgi:hypothetical protein
MSGFFVVRAKNHDDDRIAVNAFAEQQAHG